MPDYVYMWSREWIDAPPADALAVVNANGLDDYFAGGGDLFVTVAYEEVSTVPTLRVRFYRDGYPGGGGTLYAQRDLAHAFAVTEEGDDAGQLSGYENMTGVTWENVQFTTGKLYFSIVDTGTGAYRVDVFCDPDRKRRVAYSDEYTAPGAVALHKDHIGSLGTVGTIGGTLTIDAVSAPDSDIAVNMGLPGRIVMVQDLAGDVSLGSITLGTAAMALGDSYQCRALFEAVEVPADLPNPRFICNYPADDAERLVGNFPDLYSIVDPAPTAERTVADWQAEGYVGIHGDADAAPGRVIHHQNLPEADANALLADTVKRRYLQIGDPIPTTEQTYDELVAAGIVGVYYRQPWDFAMFDHFKGLLYHMADDGEGGLTPPSGPGPGQYVQFVNRRHINFATVWWPSYIPLTWNQLEARGFFMESEPMIRPLYNDDVTVHGRIWTEKTDGSRFVQGNVGDTCVLKGLLVAQTAAKLMGCAIVERRNAVTGDWWPVKTEPDEYGNTYVQTFGTADFVAVTQGQDLTMADLFGAAPEYTMDTAGDWRWVLYLHTFPADFTPPDPETWTPPEDDWLYGEFELWKHSECAGFFHDFEVLAVGPPVPTVAITDKTDGTGATATLADGHADAANSIQVVPAKSTTWTEAATRIGNGSADLALDPGMYWAYVRSTVTESSVSAPVLFVTTDAGVQSEVIALAEAVKDELNSEAWSLDFVATREYVQLLRLEDLTDTTVIVTPKSRTMPPDARSRDANTYRIDVGIFRHVQTKAEVDALVALADDIYRHFRRRRLTGAACTEVSMEPIFDPVHMREESRFSSVLTLTFKKVS